MKLMCEISLGELVDKLSILKVKEREIGDKIKRDLIEREMTSLEQRLDELHLEGVTDYLDQLVGVNYKLWKIEDDIRQKERVQSFDEEFIELARSVYQINDQRFEIKNKINEIYGSEIREVKSYQKYR